MYIVVCDLGKNYSCHQERLGLVPYYNLPYIMQCQYAFVSLWCLFLRGLGTVRPKNLISTSAQLKKKSDIRFE